MVPLVVMRGIARVPPPWILNDPDQSVVPIPNSMDVKVVNSLLSFATCQLAPKSAIQVSWLSSASPDTRKGSVQEHGR